MSSLSTFGPGSAFGFAPVTRQPRRTPSSGSYTKDPALTSPTVSGPQPVDHHAPSLGAWGADPAAGAEEVAGRSFSSILAPIPDGARAEAADPLAKPFVYSREFLLGLYDDDKAKRRPIELVANEVATRDAARKPWALEDWREGEKELFSSSIHPANTRNNRGPQRLDGSTGTPISNGTLDLSTLGTLPRDRDRSLASPSLTPATLRTGLGSALNSPREEKDFGSARRVRGTTPNGLVGGVLGGIGAARGVRRDDLATPSKPMAGAGGAPSSLAGTPGSESKPVWQGGRWRRQATEEVEERPSAFGVRKYPTTDDGNPANANGGSVADDGVPNSWDDGDAAGSPQVGTPAAATPARQATPPSANLAEQDLAAQAANVLGSLALDADDDALLAGSLAPPGLAPAAPAPVVSTEWQYRDPSGVVQGPFAAQQMHGWYLQQFFTDDLLVKRTSDKDFETLDQLCVRAGRDEPFLTAPPQPAPAAPAPTSIASWLAGQQPQTQPQPSPLDQFGAQSRFAGSFFGQTSAVSSPVAQHAQVPQPQAQFGAFGAAPGGQRLDPWGAPLPATSNGWAEPAQQPNNLFGGSAFQQPAFGQPQQAHDLFGRAPGQAFFGTQEQPQAVDQWAHLRSGSAAPSPVQQSQQIAQPWNNLGAVAAAVPAPIGPPASGMNSPQPAFAQAVAAAAEAAAVAEVAAKEEVVVVPAPVAVAAAVPSAWAAPVAAVEAIAIAAEIEAAKAAVATPVKQQAKKEKAAPAAVAETAPATPAAAIPKASTPVALTPAASPKPAPWLEDKPVAAGPSLREIQEMEAKEAEKRKADKVKAAAQAQALAAIQAAQVAAAAEAETLPSSANWAAASPAAKAAPAPWSKPKGAAASIGKSLMQIQEEEAKAARAAAVAKAAQQTATNPVAGVKGYAGSIGQGAPKPAGAPWTTVAVKPSVIASVPVAKPVIPGGPVVGAGRTAITTVLPAKPVAPVVRAAAVVAPAPSPIRSVSVARPAASSAVASPAFDADSPPPPSGEFLKWTREALKGLTVPMEEFIQMLLSFPLDASADVLEIISDSVYANSSTLDGRRFANDFSARRKVDVAARFPGYGGGRKVASGGVPAGAVKAGSMAEALRAPVVPKQAEWNVKVAGGKKKKGGK